MLKLTTPVLGCITLNTLLPSDGHPEFCSLDLVAVNNRGKSASPPRALTVLTIILKYRDGKNKFKLTTFIVTAEHITLVTTQAMTDMPSQAKR